MSNGAFKSQIPSFLKYLAPGTSQYYCSFPNLSTNPATSWQNTGNSKHTTGRFIAWQRENKMKPNKGGRNNANSKTYNEGAVHESTHFTTLISGGKHVMPQSIQCHGSEVLQQSRTLAHKSSLTDLHIACELTASRDSGTDASQANAAFTAGSVTKQHGACSRVSPTSRG